MKPWEVFNKLRAVSYLKIGTDFDWCIEVDDKMQTIRVMFQESSSVIDWILNFVFMIIPVVIGGCPYWFTLGWWISWCSGKELVLNAVMTEINKHPKYTVYCNGYSFGGAIAQICGVEIYERCGIKTHLETFGAPKPIFGFLSKLLVKRCFASVNQWAHWCDIVTWCVPLPGYHQVKNNRIGKFNFFNLFKPVVYHQCYYNPDLYK